MFMGGILGSSFNRAELVGGNLVDLAINPDDAQVRYRCLPTGEEQTAVGLGAGFTTIGTWLKHGAAGDYTLEYTAPGGDFTSPDALNTPHAMSSTVEFGYLRTAVGELAAAGDVNIVWVPSGEIIATASLNLTASVDPA